MLARYYSANLIVAHAFLPSQAALEAEALSHGASQEREHNQSRLSRVAHSLATGGLIPLPILAEGPVEQAIPALAEQESPSLVVLSTSGAGRFQRAFIGSTADKILRSTRWPCFLVGPQVPAPAADAVPFKRILFATDFTPAATQAAVYAVSLAREAGADIDVLNVVPERAVEHPRQVAELEERLHRELEKAVPDQARDFCNPRTFVDIGNAHKQIKEHIHRYGVDLLVIGVRKSSHLDIEMRTSDAFALIAEAPCPVLTVLG
jgi:nucleotide-binding universal stress UspA family protein